MIIWSILLCGKCVCSKKNFGFSSIHVSMGYTYGNVLHTMRRTNKVFLKRKRTCKIFQCDFCPIRRINYEYISFGTPKPHNIIILIGFLIFSSVFR